MIIDFLFPNIPLIQNIFVLLCTIVIVGLFFAINGKFVRKRVTPATSRKIVHIGIGTIYMICLAFFANDPSARFLGIVTPGLFVIVFVLIGLGIIDNKYTRNFVEQMTRNNEPRELLKGIFYYGLISCLLANVLWTDNPLAISSLTILYGGDGFADLIGRRWGKHQYQLPWGRSRSFEGSAAFFIFGLIWSVAFICYFALIGWVKFEVVYALPAIVVICIFATVAEALSPRDLDNLIIPITAILIGLFLRILNVWFFPLYLWGFQLPI